MAVGVLYQAAGQPMMALPLYFVCKFVHRTVHCGWIMLRDMFSSEIEGRAILIRSDDAGHSLASNGVLARPDLLGVKGPTKMALEFNRLRESCAPEGAERMYLKSKFKTPKRSLIASFLALMLAGAPAQALEPMSEEKHINYSLISAAIGALIEETCPSIGRRNLTILSKTLALQNYALKKGYTRTQIKAYIKSKSAKDYVRAQAESYLAARGVVVGEKETYCAQGRAEIANKTLAGSLMRVRN